MRWFAEGEQAATCEGQHDLLFTAEAIGIVITRWTFQSQHSSRRGLSRGLECRRCDGRVNCRSRYNGFLGRCCIDWVARLGGGRRASGRFLFHFRFASYRGHVLCMLAEDDSDVCNLASARTDSEVEVLCLVGRLL